MRPEDKPQPPRRFLLWMRDPRCTWCGRITRLEAPQDAPELATRDHLHRKGERGDRRLPADVLACYECNTSRGQPPPLRRACPLLGR